MASRIVVGKGRARVEIGPELEAFVDRMVRGAAPAASAAIDKATERVAEDARAEWPVKTGRSRDAITHGVRLVSADVIEGFVANEAPYAHLIKGKRHDGKQTWRVLLQKPMKAAAAEIAEALAQDLRRLGSRNGR